MTFEVVHDGTVHRSNSNLISQITLTYCHQKIYFDLEWVLVILFIENYILRQFKIIFPYSPPPLKLAKKIQERKKI